jgi:hypothetical protein
MFEEYLNRIQVVFEFRYNFIRREQQVLFEKQEAKKPRKCKVTSYTKAIIKKQAESIVIQIYKINIHSNKVNKHQRHATQQNTKSDGSAVQAYDSNSKMPPKVKRHNGRSLLKHESSNDEIL